MNLFRFTPSKPLIEPVQKLEQLTAVVCAALIVVLSCLSVSLPLAALGHAGGDARGDHGAVRHSL